MSLFSVVRHSVPHSVPHAVLRLKSFTHVAVAIRSERLDFPSTHDSGAIHSGRGGGINILSPPGSGACARGDCGSVGSTETSPGGGKRHDVDIFPF
ncbi:hypothetical protein AVEN_147187-1 [Araneus ventricosus]|uniref:Uncharacterized protein n=1 Tax=Araneus ventricosus TaxID=182803 RepID=A0A4Y2UAR2_ARAVE|nr:hypothetical protein AVEN_147187-1 [Araneus ventricosus]